MTPTPYVGAVVHYQCEPDDWHDNDCRAAILTAVPSGDVCALVVFDDQEGMSFTACYYDGSDTPKAGTWHWPEHAASSPTVRIDVPHVKVDVHPRRIAQDLADALGRRGTRRTGMDFGGALKALKDGMKATREAWQPPGQYVTLQHASPGVIFIDTAEQAQATGLRQGAACRFQPYFMLGQVDGPAPVSFSPWMPGVDDLLAEDWLVASPDGDIRWPDGTVA
jgi:hypothetical protein